MANVQIELKGKIEALKGDEERWLIGATIREHFSRLTDMTVEFVTKGPIKLKDLVGQEMSVKLITKEAGGEVLEQDINQSLYNGARVVVGAPGVFADLKEIAESSFAPFEAA